VNHCACPDLKILADALLERRILPCWLGLDEAANHLEGLGMLR
jgi:hypothetical protein